MHSSSRSGNIILSARPTDFNVGGSTSDFVERFHKHLCDTYSDFQWMRQDIKPEGNGVIVSYSVVKRQSSDVAKSVIFSVLGNGQDFILNEVRYG